jgi:hypothetical protein
MKDSIRKPENTSRSLDNQPRASRQAPINEILQAYKDGTLGKQPVQRESVEDEDLLQAKTSGQAPASVILQQYKESIQRYASKEEDELIQGKSDTVQREELDEEELLQGKFESTPTTEQEPIQRDEKPNNTGLPDELKTGIETLSGYSMDDVKVHYNSDKPVQLNALAYAQGTDIHVAPGQEKYLPHETWHVVQQKQGRVQPTMQLQGVNVNDNEGLEKEADIKGEEILTRHSNNSSILENKLTSHNIIQLMSDGNRSSIKDFFSRFKSKKDNKLHLYSFIHNDGLGDAGQLKLLYDKICSSNIDSSPILLSVFEEVSTDELKINNRKQKIQSILPVEDKNIKHRNSQIQPSAIRESAFPDKTGNIWEVEYPVPDESFKISPENQLLKIKEMGGGEVESCFKTGESLDRIGFGVPETSSDNISAENTKSAEIFFKTKTGNPDLNTAELLNTAWIVSIKNYKMLNDNPLPLIESSKIDNIKNKAKESGAKLILFIGMAESDSYLQEDNTHIIFSKFVENITLRDIFNKSKNSFIISGGEGMYAESLSSEDGNATVLAGRYAFQYQEIGWTIFLADTERYKSKLEKTGFPFFKSVKMDSEIKKYRFFGLNNRHIYYFNNENKFISILDKNQQKDINDLDGQEILFSKNLSALYLPLSLNHGNYNMPEIFDNFDQVKQIFATLHQKQKNNSWFKLINQEEPDKLRLPD